MVAQSFAPSFNVSKQDESIEIVFEDPKKDLEFVPSTPSNEPEPKVKNEVKLKSDRTQRVELETFRKQKISQVNAPVQSGGQGGKQQKKVQKEKQKASQESFDPDAFKISEDRKPLPLPGFSGPSGRPLIPEFVQQNMPRGVRLGNVTALNTDQHRFYSFNQRLLASFIPLWGNQVRHAVYQWLAKNNYPSISKSWVTNVEVIMNKKGEILEVQPFRLSGTWPIDNAAIDAFKQIANVPNPPEEMVDENGYIHLQFQTEVLYIPQPNMRFQGGGSGN